MPARQEEVPELVHEHQHAEHEEKRQNRRHVGHRSALARGSAGRSPPAVWTQYTCGPSASSSPDGGQRVAAAAHPGRGARPSRAASMLPAIAGNGSAPVEKRRHGDLVGRIEHHRIGRAGLERAVGQAQTRESGRGRAPRTRGAGSRAGRACGSAPSQRSGHEKAYWIGSRMSVTPSWAMTDPSVSSTSEWTIDCGWTTTSMADGGDAEQPVRLDHLEALVHQRRRVDGDLAAHPPGRMAERVVGGDAGQRARAAGARNGPPEAVRISRRSSPRGRAGAGTGGWRCARCRPAARRRRARARPIHHQAAGHDQHFLVGERDALAGANGRRARPRARRCPTTRTARCRRRRGSTSSISACGAGAAQIECARGPVGSCARSAAQRGVGGHRHRARPVALDLQRHRRGARRRRPAPTTCESIGVGVDHRQRAVADRAGRAEDGEAHRGRQASSQPA